LTLSDSLFAGSAHRGEGDATGSAKTNHDIFGIFQIIALVTHFVLFDFLPAGHHLDVEAFLGGRVNVDRGLHNALFGIRAANGPGWRRGANGLELGQFYGFHHLTQGAVQQQADHHAVFFSNVESHTSQVDSFLHRGRSEHDQVILTMTAADNVHNDDRKFRAGDVREPFLHQADARAGA